MATNFFRTLRSLEADRPRRPVLVAVLLVLAAWGAWLGLARVPVFEVTQNARLEVSRAAHPLAASLPGRIVRADLSLGRQVTEGDVLVELDATDAQLAVREKQARIEALQSRHAAIEQEIAAERATLTAQREARQQSADEAKAQVAGIEAQLRFARAEFDRHKILREKNTIPQSEFDKAQSSVETTQFKLTESKAASQRADQDRRALEQERETRIVRLERERVELTGDLAVERAAIRRLEQEIAERKVKAPVSGKIGEVSGVRLGSVVSAGSKLCAIVPAGSPRAVAHFSPVVVGRLKPGQRARLRLDGFPWTQFGTVAASVSDIGTEPQEGFIRVELALAPQSTSNIPLDHGLTGSVEIEVEQVSPAVLILRAAGQFLGTRRNAPP